MHPAAIFWTVYLTVSLISIVPLASMAYRHSVFVWHREKESHYRPEPTPHIFAAVGLSLVWPIAYVAVGALFYITKEEREEVEARKRQKTIEDVRAYLKEQEAGAKSQFDRLLGNAPESTPIRKALARAGMKRRNGVGGPW